MKVFAIADLHLDGGAGKPMEVFGSRWERHRERIFDSWQDVVGADDCVLIPGDICWAMYFADAKSELDSIAALNGNKILLRGNHDYWWSSLSQMRSVFPPDMHLVQNDSVDMNKFVVAGSRGWSLPTDSCFGAEDAKIYSRELIRLELSLKSVRNHTVPLICMMHFPPLSGDGVATGFTQIIERFGVSFCAYGHLHGKSCTSAFEGMFNGVDYALCSADHLQFTPRLIAEF